MSSPSSATETRKIGKFSKEYWNLLVYGYIRLMIQLLIPKEIQNILVDYFSLIQILNVITRMATNRYI